MVSQCSIFSWKTTIVNYFNSRSISSFVDTTTIVVFDFNSENQMDVADFTECNDDNNEFERKILHRYTAHNRFHSSNISH